MKKVLSIFLITCCLTATLAGQELQRKKVGVVLSGGGAKGFAHVGVLRVLEEAGIPIDFIAGTSMGAVVGGLYAAGYSSHMIDSLVKVQDWSYLMRDDIYRKNQHVFMRDRRERYLISLPYQLQFRGKRGKVTLPPGVYEGQNIYALFLKLTAGYHQNIDFDQLPIPFGCVAADVRTGREVVLREGNLLEAIRASMAIPGVFTPVEKDSMLLIDGGVINNFPVDLVREMGADLVIGVIFPPDREQIEKQKGSINEVTGQLWNFIGQGKRRRNMADTDLLITPDVNSFGMLEFQRPAIDTIISRGREAAEGKWKELIELKESLTPDGSIPVAKPGKNPYLGLDTLRINTIRIEGIPQQETSHIARWIDLQKQSVTREELDRMTARIYGSGWFSKVSYRLEGENPFDLVFMVEVKESNNLNLGIYFDTNDMAAILANTTIRLNTSLNSLFDLSARLSRNPYLMIDYSINKGIFYRGGLNYTISSNDISIYRRGDIIHNLGITRNALDLVFSEFYFGNIMLQLKGGMEHFHFFKALQSRSDPRQTEPDNQLFFSYRLNGVYDNLNRINFPTSGLYFAFQYSLHTDNFVGMRNNTPLSVLKMDFYKPLPVNDKFCITPRINARYVMNDSVPYMYRNIVGGKFDGQYLQQQISLQGSAGMELMQNALLAADLMLHYRFSAKSHLYTNINFTTDSGRLQTLFKGDAYTGVNVGYSSLTVAGPLRVELGYSGLSRKFHPFVSFGYFF